MPKELFDLAVRVGPTCKQFRNGGIQRRVKRIKRHHLLYQSDGQGLGGSDALGTQSQVLGMALAHRVDHIRTNDRWQDAEFGFTDGKAGIVGSDSDVTGTRQADATTQRRTITRTLASIASCAKAASIAAIIASSKALNTAGRDMVIWATPGVRSEIVKFFMLVPDELSGRWIDGLVACSIGFKMQPTFFLQGGAHHIPRQTCLLGRIAQRQNHAFLHAF